MFTVKRKLICPEDEPSELHLFQQRTNKDLFTEMSGYHRNQDININLSFEATVRENQGFFYFKQA